MKKNDNSASAARTGGRRARRGDSRRRRWCPVERGAEIDGDTRGLESGIPADRSRTNGKQAQRRETLSSSVRVDDGSRRGWNYDDTALDLQAKSMIRDASLRAKMFKMAARD